MRYDDHAADPIVRRLQTAARRRLIAAIALMVLGVVALVPLVERLIERYA
jgi:predicted PurR-regulated permease PerM